MGKDADAGIGLVQDPLDHQTKSLDRRLAGATGPDVNDAVDVSLHLAAALVMPLALYVLNLKEMDEQIIEIVARQVALVLPARLGGAGLERLGPESRLLGGLRRSVDQLMLAARAMRRPPGQLLDRIETHFSCRKL